MNRRLSPWLIRLAAALVLLQAAAWARTWEARPRQGLLIVSVPAGARVVIDGRDLGATPLHLDGAGLAVLGGGREARLELRRGAAAVPVTLTRVEPGHPLQVVEVWLPPYPLALAVKAATTVPFLLAALPLLGMAGWERTRTRAAEPALEEVAAPVEGGRLGAYRLGPLLGRGAMGEVYQAHDLDAGREVAVKVLYEELSADDEFRQRFEREVDICSRRLRHPNVVAVYGMGQAGERLYMAMQYVDGGPLSAAAPWDTAALVRVALGICAGLRHAHGAGVIHRDLKPDNILMTRDGTPCLADFGLARGRHYPTITAAGSAVGTPAYMAPEQARGERPDARADLYSLGCILYQMACGRPPFDGADALEVLTRQLYADPEPPPGAPAPLQAIIMRLLEKDPAHRFQSADEVVAALKRGQALRRW